VADRIEPEAPAVGPSTRSGRVATRQRNPKWKHVPLYIDMSICINCDTCLRHCPPQFGAIFNYGMDVVILPELCSGCGKCLPPVCPVDCIYEAPIDAVSPDDWWALPFGADDTYL
jgi:Na+-translocating ferredoxin:NAD+ oxidoreductase subunit B